MSFDGGLNWKSTGYHGCQMMLSTCHFSEFKVINQYLNAETIIFHSQDDMIYLYESDNQCIRKHMNIYMYIYILYEIGLSYHLSLSIYIYIYEHWMNMRPDMS